MDAQSVSESSFSTKQIQKQVVPMKSSKVYLSLDLRFVGMLTQGSTWKITSEMLRTARTECIHGAMAQRTVHPDLLSHSKVLILFWRTRKIFGCGISTRPEDEAQNWATVDQGQTLDSYFAEPEPMNVMVGTTQPLAKSQRAVENREKWRKLVAKSSVVPQRPPRLRDWWWWWWWMQYTYSTMMYKHKNLFFLSFFLDNFQSYLWRKKTL